MAGGKFVTPEVFRAIHSMHNIDKGNSEIAAAIGVAPGTVTRVLKCRTWARWMKFRGSRSTATPNTKALINGLERRLRRIEDHLKLPGQLELRPQPPSKAAGDGK